ncbi:hypothetical protein [Phaeovulum vinaykumarii]|uniref:Uncharacterized protein n=1 Tax=Phaeovulum vinaykumarii TaxID=407234 RepID=A0A1N7MMK3_9RHOB|nr:hypothetical protein [Phaeovulum vinaykumarii]SIS87317.1 hypothetical protein SAMN05421795_10896 [Phaeovulum vinaykumarii]SOC13204.1 hypothetical protein SAMN05878426_10850 [Phaeovulum vinaykumarii]
MDLDDAYANAAHIPEGALYPDRWVAQAAAFRRALGARLTPGLVYGPGRRCRRGWPRGWGGSCRSRGWGIWRP